MDSYSDFNAQQDVGFTEMPFAEVPFEDVPFDETVWCFHFSAKSGGMRYHRLIFMAQEGHFLQVFYYFEDLYFSINAVGEIPIYSLNCRL